MGILISVFTLYWGIKNFVINIFELIDSSNSFLKEWASEVSLSNL